MLINVSALLTVSCVWFVKIQIMKQIGLNGQKKAYEATYGYEFQGDNLLLARENLLYTFIDFYKHHFGKRPNLNQIKQIANILAWNIWQMDGLKECAPFDAADEAQYELFDNLPTLNFPINCRIKNWRTKQV